MVGIVGFCDWHGQAGEASGSQARLTQLVAGREVFAPDGCAQYWAKHVGLAQFLDYQTEEAKRVTTPVCDAQSAITLVGDLRIDNRDELADTLGLLGHERLAISDEELLLRGIVQRGIRFVELLLGDFFVAIWDERRQRLTLVRDGLGVKPGNYAITSQGVVFGSMTSWVISDAAVSPRPCLSKIADFVGMAFEDVERTFYEDVRRVPPGTYIEFDAKGQSQVRYWHLAFGPELTLRDNREYSEQFRSLLTTAVATRLRGRTKPALLLSGGLDSSSIAGIARVSGICADSHPLLTVSALFPDYPAIDETNYIDEVLANGCLQSAFVRVDRSTPLENLDAEINCYGEPFYSPNNFVDSRLLDAAKSAGARLIIDGLDGDTTVGHGWEYMGELMRRGKLRRLFRLARQLASHTDRSAFWYLARHAVAPTFSALIRLALPFRRATAPRIMSEKLAKTVGYQESRQQQLSPFAHSQLSSYRRQHWGKLTSGLLASSFELAWRQAATRGMARAHPYFDRRLVEYCVSLPAEQRLARGVDRIVQRRALEGLVPETIRTRLTKSIWAQNTIDRMRIDERSRVLRLLEAPSPGLEDYINTAVLRKSCSELLENRPSVRGLAEIWVACALEMWLNGTVR